MWPWRKKGAAAQPETRHLSVPNPAAGLVPHNTKRFFNQFSIGPIGSRNNIGDASNLPRVFLSENRYEALLELRRQSLLNPLLVSLISLMSDKIVGHEAMMPTWTTVKNKRTRELLTEKFNEWCKKVDRSGTESWVGFLNSLFRMAYVDGMAYALIHDNPAYPCGFALQGIDREYLAENYGNDARQDTMEGIVGGIERNKLGQIVAYHFYKSGINELNLAGSRYGAGFLFGLGAPLGGEVVRIPAARVLPLFFRNRASDVSPYPSEMLAAWDTLASVKRIDNHTLDHMEAASQVGGFLNQSAEAEVGKAKDLWSKLLTNFRDAVGGFQLLPKGVTMTPFKTDTPNARAESYRMELIRSAAGAAGTDAGSLLGDGRGTSYSTLRHFDNRSKDKYRVKQESIVSKVVAPVVEHFLMMAPMVDAELRAALNPTSLRQAKMTPISTRIYPAIDPVKEVTAQQKLVQLGALDPNRVAMEHGSKPGEVIDSVKALMKKMGETPEERAEFMAAVRFLATGSLSEKTAAPAAPKPAPAPSGDGQQQE